MTVTLIRLSSLLSLAFGFLFVLLLFFFFAGTCCFAGEKFPTGTSAVAATYRGALRDVVMNAREVEDAVNVEKAEIYAV